MSGANFTTAPHSRTLQCSDSRQSRTRRCSAHRSSVHYSRQSRTRPLTAHSPEVWQRSQSSSAPILTMSFLIVMAAGSGIAAMIQA
eukprot:1947964-Amphidinium_carterae.1